MSTTGIKLTIDQREIEARPGETVLQAARRHGVDIPNFCYHDKLSIAGSCRICQVEVSRATRPRVIVACRTQPVEGMIVDTESPKAHETRRECLEFLLKNHPLDCPICDKAGECDLQDYTYDEGQAQGRSHEPRRKLDKRKSLGAVIVLDEERCILCSRCVRFTREISRTNALGIVERGNHSYVEAQVPGQFDEPVLRQRDRPVPDRGPALA